MNARIPSGRATGALFYAADSPVGNLQVETRRPYLSATTLTPLDAMFVFQHNPLPPPIFSIQPWSIDFVGVNGTRAIPLKEIWPLGSVDVTAVLQYAGNGRAFSVPPMTNGWEPRWQVGIAANDWWRGTPLRAVVNRLGGARDIRTRFS